MSNVFKLENLDLHTRKISLVRDELFWRLMAHWINIKLWKNEMCTSNRSRYNGRQQHPTRLDSY